MSVINSEDIMEGIRTIELAQTAAEGANYLGTHENETTLWDDTKNAVQLVTKKLRKYQLFPDDLRLLSQELAKTLQHHKDPAKLPSKWFATVQQTILAFHLEFLQMETILPEQAAKMLKSFVDGMHLKRAEQAKHFFGISFGCRKTSPLFSYQLMQQAFLLDPYVITMKGRTIENYLGKAAEQKTIQSCPTCGGPGRPYFNACAFFAATFEPMFEPAKLWMQCTHCGNLYTHHFPKSFLQTGQEIKKIEPIPFGNSEGIIPFASTLAIWCEILNHLRQYTQGNDVLEIGIGKGEFIAVALEMGYDIESVEILEEEAQRVANVLEAPIWCGDFLKFKTDKQYSIITMGDVIEHLIRPREALEKVHKMLKDDGVLWLSTPNFEGSFTRLRKYNDPMWCEPWHINYYSAKGLKQLAEECGFTIREYQVSSRYNGSMELILTKKS